MSRRLRMLISDDDSDDGEYNCYVRRPRWVRERRDWFADYDERDFVTRFRLTKSLALLLLQMIESDLEYSSDRNASVSPMAQLLTTLRFYATGSSQLTMGDYMGASKSTINRIIHRVSAAIASLRENYIVFPHREDVKREQLNFYSIAKFPKVVGAMDCTHIRISSPGAPNAELFRNRKSYFSLNVQAISNSNLEFLDIVARWPGSTHDSTIFNNSHRRAMFESGEYGDGVLLVDGGYASSPYMMAPLERPHTPAEHLYNESQIRSRNVVERLFGVWKRRFPVLAIGIRLKLDNVYPVILATAVLHNILRQQGEPQPPDDPEVHLPAPWQQLLLQGEIAVQVNRRCVNDAARRNLINNYFESLL